MNIKKKENPFLNILLNVIIPSFILIKGSDEIYLGPLYALIIALLFPISYGIYDFIVRKDTNIISIFGFISILLTGGISLLKLDPLWIIVKETSIPILIIIFILIFKKKSSQFIKQIFFEILDEKKINDKAKEKKLNINQEFEKITSYMTIPFLLSAFLNFLLAFLIVKSAPGTVEYSQEIGKMTALSFPVIALPSTIILMIIIFSFIKKLKTKLNLNLEEIMKT